MASPAAVLQVFVNANTKVASAQLKAFHGQMLGLEKTTAASGAGMGKFTKGAAAAGAGVAAFGAAAVVAGKQLYDLGKDFDAAYDRIRVGTGATGRELEKLKANFKSVAKTVPNDFEEIGTAIADLNTRLGLTGKPLEDMSRNVLNLSRLTGTDLEGNIKAVARSFVDWEVAIPKQTKALNGLFRVSQASGASVAQIAEDIQKFGSPLRQLGFSFEEAAAMFASFERAGVNTQTMVPGLKLAISNLTKPTENLAQSMTKLGIEAGKPDVALRQIFDLLGKGSTLSQIEKTGLAMDVFGKRAGADMAEAINQGRFELDQFLRLMNRGDTIGKVAKDTNDASENFKIFANRLKVLAEPAARAVFNVINRISEILASPFMARALRLMGKFFKITFDAIAAAVRPMVKTVRGGFNAMQDAAQFTVKAFRAIVGPIKGAIDAVIKTFSRARIAAVNFVNGIINVINKIPGVEIGLISLGSGEGSSKRGRAAGLQRGGVLMGGRPSGDSIPAMLERGEYVLNREAVKKIGVQKLNQMNFQTAPRFQKGGRVGMIDGGDVVDAATKYIPGAGLAKQAVGAGLKAASWYIDKLPSANLPEPLSGMGPWLIDHVKGWIKKKVAAIAEASMSGSSSIGFIGPPPGMAQLANNAWVDRNTWTVAGFLARKFGLTISSNYRSPAHNAAVGGVPNSSHTRGTPSNPGAFDFVPASTAMQTYAGQRVAGITENLIHDVGSGLHNHIAFFRKGGFVGNINKRYPGIQAPNWGGYRLPRYVIAALAQAAGMPGRTMEQMTRGESLGRPGSWGIDPGGRSAGYGLWAITSPFNNDLAGKVGGYRNFLNPVLNAWAASKILARQGLGAWYGDKYVTGSNLNYTGNYDIRKALGGYGYLGALWKATGGRLGQKPKGRLGGGGKKEWPTGGVSPGTNKGSFLARNARRIAYISERISLAERKASADFGPGGSSLTQGEINEQIKLYERLLKFQMARRDGIKKLIKELKGKEGKSERVGELRGMLASLVGVTGKGGAIGDTRFRLRELGITSPDASAADSEVASLLRDQLAQTKRQLAIAEAQMPVFQQFMPRYHQGGIVQGPTGAERPVMAQAGEGIFTRDQMRALGANNITVVIEDGAIDSNRIRVEVDGVLQDKVSTVRRTTPNRRYSTR